MRRKAQRGSEKVRRTFRQRNVRIAVGLTALFGFGLMVTGAFGDSLALMGTTDTTAVSSTDTTAASTTDTTGASSTGTDTSSTGTDTSSTGTDTASTPTATDTTPAAIQY